MKRQNPVSGLDLRIRACLVVCLLGLTSCGDENPTAPGAEVQPAPQGAAAYLDSSGPRFNQSALSTCLSVSDVQAVSSNFPLCLVSRTQTETLLRIPFEGMGNRVPAGTIAYTSFPDWMSLRAKWMGSGSTYTGNTYNEPAGGTSLFWSYPTRPALAVESTRDILLERPVYQFGLKYTAATSVFSDPFSPPISLTGGMVHLRAFDGAGAQLAVSSGNDNYDKAPLGQRPPNGLWVFNKWDPLLVTAPTTSGGLPDNRIKKLTINGFEDYIGVDDVFIRIINFRPNAVITGGPHSVPQGTPLTLNGGVSFDPVDAAGLPHPQGDAVSYSWNFGDGVGTASVANPTYTYLKKGEFTATLTVTDPNGMSHSSTVPVSVTNVAPSVTAPSTATSLVNEALVLPATFIDPGLDAPWSYTINWGDGTVKSGTVTATGALPQADLTHTYTARANYTVGVQVTDVNGSAGSANVAVTIGNRAPTAVFGVAPTSGNEGATLSYTAAGSTDPDGDALNFTWSVSKGGSSIVHTSTGSTLSYTFPDDGEYGVNLTVSDGALSAAVSTNVSIANVAPTATALAPAEGTVGEPLTLSITNPSDPSPIDRDNLTYAFDCGSGYGPSSSSMTQTCVPGTPGSLTVRAKVTDPNGASSEYSASVDVVAANAAPIASMDINGTPVEGSSMSFSGLGSSDPDGHSLSYTWTIANQASPANVTTVNGATQSVMFPQDGVYVITLTVFDTGPRGGLSSSVVRTLTINNAAPTAFLTGGVGGIAGQPVSVSGGFADAGVEDGPWSWSIDWGDGSSSTGSYSSLSSTTNTSHTYSAPGTYTARITVTDEDGATGTAEIEIVVVPANNAPSASIGLSGSMVEGSTVTLSGAGSSDPDGDSLGYTWTIENQAAPATVTTLTGVNQAVSFPRDGTYLITLTVQDSGPNGGLSDVATRVISIANVAPTISATAVTGVVGQPVSLPFSIGDAGAFDGPWTITAVWGSGQVSTVQANALGNGTITNTFGAPGTYHVALAVVDKDGAGGGTQVTVVVNGPPTAVINGPSTADQFDTVQFTATGSAPYISGGALTYTWTYGSTTVSGPTASFVLTGGGNQTIQLTVTEPGTGLSRTVTKVVDVEALPAVGAFILRDATFNGGTSVTGSVQIMTAANATFNGGTVTGALFMAGMPTVQTSGNVTFGGTVNGVGSATPTGHTVRLNGNTRLGRVVRRTNPLTMPTVASPASPTGTRNVSLNKSSDSPGSFASLRDLTLNGNGITMAVPGGTYGTFTANGDNVLVLGVAGSTTPTTYNFQSLTLNGSSSLRVVGPVIITLKNGVSFNAAVGQSGRPDWLTLRVATGGVTLNSSVSFDGYIVAPNGGVTVNGRSVLNGGITAQTLTMNGNGRLTLVPRP